MISPQKRLEQFLYRLQNNKDILPSNRKKIAEFIKSREAKGKAPNTSIKYLYPLYQMNALGWIKKPFEKLTKEEVEKVVIEVERKSWSPKTKKNFTVAIKVFYRWLEGEENFAPREYPNKVKFISTTIPKRDRKEITLNDLLTRDEVIKMAQHTTNPMHKALLWVAFESGGRPEEVLNLRKSDITFDVYGTKIFLSGAKSKRPSRLVSATEPLRDWLRKHPFSHEKDFDVWVTQFSKKQGQTKHLEDKDGKKILNPKYFTWNKLSDAGANKMLKELARKCNIQNKKVTMYALRKGRATELAASPHLSRAVLHAVMGWEEGSNISRSYVKLSGQETEEALLRASGIEMGKKEISSYIKCQSCGTKNSPSALYCENTECDKPIVLAETRDKQLEEMDIKIISLQKTVESLLDTTFTGTGLQVKEKDVKDDGSFMVRLVPKYKKKVNKIEFSELDNKLGVPEILKKHKSLFEPVKKVKR